MAGDRCLDRLIPIGRFFCILTTLRCAQQSYVCSGLFLLLVSYPGFFSTLPPPTGFRIVFAMSYSQEFSLLDAQPTYTDQRLNKKRNSSKFVSHQTSCLKRLARSAPSKWPFGCYNCFSIPSFGGRNRRKSTSPSSHRSAFT